MSETRKLFTPQQVEALSKYEKAFHTAVYSNYARGMSAKALAEIKAIYDQTTGGNEYIKDSCSACVLAFLTRVGNLYYESVLQETKPSSVEEVVKEALKKVKRNKKR